MASFYVGTRDRKTGKKMIYRVDNAENWQDAAQEVMRQIPNSTVLTLINSTRVAVATPEPLEAA